MASVAKWLRQWIVVPPLVGSSPIVRPLVQSNSIFCFSELLLDSEIIYSIKPKNQKGFIKHFSLFRDDIGLIFDFCWRSLRWRIKNFVDLKSVFSYCLPTQIIWLRLP